MSFTRFPLATASALVLALTALAFSAFASQGPRNFEEALQQARGQTVYWNAWGGDESINAYIAWVGERMAALHEIELEHVKLADTAEAVSRVLAEKTAGRDAEGSIDLIWINGENFAAMKQNDLLFGPFTQLLPNFHLVDFEGKPTTLNDFTVPTDGLEAPWGMAQFNIIAPDAEAAFPSLAVLPDYLAESGREGRFTYPAPPDFLGTTFLKQALIEMTEDSSILQSPPPGDDTAFAEITAPLWAYLDELHPMMWRGGRSFPQSGPALVQLMNDGESDFALSFYPAEADSLVAQDRLPEGARAFGFESGTIGNTHFVAIPYNAPNKAAALVLANFLMGPEAQARKQNPDHWGDATVLSMDKLSDVEARAFDAENGSYRAPLNFGPALPEPHPGWTTRLEEEWLKRYGG